MSQISNLKNMDKPIYVTSPSLPPLDEFVNYLKEIWENKRLTNEGKFHKELEKELCKYLGVKYISVFSNGTLALITALQALRITGEVITTPFSFVATTHSLWWNNIKPVFVDIEPVTYNLDPAKIEAAITPKTTAIMPVHVYGNPCNLVAIKEIADRYGLKVIYDAAHAFAVKQNCSSIMNAGDLSVLSFHATKTYNTIEGGAIVSPDEVMKKRIDFLKNFGFADEVTVVGPGINAKLNEVQAAFGLLQLKYVDGAIAKRKLITDYYRKHLLGIDGITTMQDMPDVIHNYSYMPILVDKAKYGKTRNDIYDELSKINIFPRKYFYPLISQFPTYKGLESAQPGKMPVAERITEEVLCLPIYPDLEYSTIDKIIRCIKSLAK